MPLLNSLGKMNRQPTAIEAMGWVSDYSETKHICNFLPDFTYNLQFPGDRDKFERFVNKMHLQNHKISEDEYTQVVGENRRSARFTPENKGYEIEYSASKT